MVERFALVARLKPDAHDRAEELASADAPPDAAPAGVRTSVFLSPQEVVFLVEGEDVGRRVTDWFNDPALSTSISPWLPLFDGPLHSAREVAR